MKLTEGNYSGRSILEFSRADEVLIDEARQSIGSIVNISSTAGLFGFPNRAPYATAKWGVIGLT